MSVGSTLRRRIVHNPSMDLSFAQVKSGRKEKEYKEREPRMGSTAHAKKQAAPKVTPAIFMARKINYIFGFPQNYSKSSKSKYPEHRTTSEYPKLFWAGGTLRRKP